MLEKVSAFISIEKIDRVSVIHFDRSDGKNALSFQALRELISAVESFKDDFETSAIIFTGTEQVFSLGFDLKDNETKQLNAISLAERRQILQLGPRLCKAIEKLEPFTIAAIDGWCIGGGMAITLACDFRIAGADSISFAPEIERGMNMSWQTVPRAIALMGPAKTKRIFILSEQLNATKGLDWGYLDKIALNGKALEAAMPIAKRIAEMPPVHVRMIKQGINAAAFALSDAVSSLDRDQYLLALNSDDASEGLQSFLEKRPPQYKGR